MPPPTRADGTDNEPTGLLIVCCLAALAGAVDAVGFARLTDLYVSFMSGNTTSLGRAIAQGNGAKVSLIVEILAMFVAGAAAGEAVAIAAARYRLPVVLCVAAAVLILPLIAPGAAIEAMTFAMGMLNAAMHKAGQIQVAVTYVTGTLVKLGQGIGQMLCGQARDTVWLQQSVPWLGLLAGATAASLAIGPFPDWTMACLPTSAVLIAGLAWAAIPRAAAGLRHPT